MLTSFPCYIMYKDLDSVCSAVMYAYFRSTSTPKCFHIPLSNLPRADLALRPELAAVLHHANLSPSDLITLDDLPAGLVPAETAWVLVDHNALTGPLERFQSRVTSCIDHHVNEGKLPDTVSPCVIKTSGSCSSLIIQECRHLWAKEMAPDALNDAALARLALAPILIDTGNLLIPEKTTPDDVHAAQILGEKLGLDFVQTNYFDEVSKFKSDLSQMSLRDVLRKDYKEWTDGGILLGTAASARGFEYLLEKAEHKPEVFVAAVKNWAIEKKTDVMAVMTIVAGESFGRQLMLWGVTEKGISVVKNFETLFSDKIGLQKWNSGAFDGDDFGYRRTWTQQNTALSRKQIAPMLREVMGGSAKI